MPGLPNTQNSPLLAGFSECRYQSSGASAVVLEETSPAFGIEPNPALVDSHFATVGKDKLTHPAGLGEYAAEYTSQTTDGFGGSVSWLQHGYVFTLTAGDSPALTQAVFLQAAQEIAAATANLR